MLLDPLGKIFSLVANTDHCNPHLVHNLESLEHTRPHTDSPSSTSVLSTAVLEARSWAGPALVQDLASLFCLESSPSDLAEGSPPIPSGCSRSTNGGCPSRDSLPAGSRDGRPKTRTKFLLAHPPPTSRSKQRLSTRPRMIFQIQRVSDTLRPLPAFEVISSTALACRFARSVPRMMGEEKGRSTDNLVLVRSETYGQESITNGDTMDNSGDETTRHHHDLLGMICYTRKARDGLANQDEICLGNGLVWKAACLKTGVYEFSGRNHDGLKLRWVSRRARRTSSQQNSPPDSASKPSTPRFTFSIINSNTRLHPVIATLTGDTKLDILDRFPTGMPSTSTSPPSSNPQSPVLSDFSSETSYFDRPIDTGTSYIETDEALQTLIILTSIWVISKEGWSGTLSRSSESFIKPRQDIAHGSPPTVVSSIETIHKESPLLRRRPFRPQRSSTSHLSQQVADHQSASAGRANSTKSISAQRTSLNVAQSDESNTSSLSPELCCGQYEADRYRSTVVAVGGQGKASSLALWRHIDVTNRQERSPPMDIPETPQDCAKAPLSPLNRNMLGPGKAGEKKASKDGVKPRAKKLGQFRAACKSLVSPCMA